MNDPLYQMYFIKSEIEFKKSITTQDRALNNETKSLSDS